MRVYAVQIAQHRTHKMRVAAPSLAAAQSSARILLHTGDKILSISEITESGNSSGAEALAHLLSQRFLDLDGEEHNVSGWIAAAARRPELHSNLSLAGLRLLPDAKIAIASAACIPMLNSWFENTPWAGTQLLLTLGNMPGATRANLTFAGQRSRVAILPLSLVLAGETL